MKIRVLQIDGRRPIARTKEKGHILRRVHPKMRTIDEEAVQSLEVDDRPPPDRFRDEKQTGKESWGRKGRLLDSSFLPQRLHFRVDEIHVILARDDRKRRRRRKGERRRTTEGNDEPFHIVHNGGRSAEFLPNMKETSKPPPH